VPPNPLITALRENHESASLPVISACLEAEALERYRACWPLLKAIRLHLRYWMGKTSALFLRADRNHDGRLSHAEIVAVMDSDGDGEITREEFQAAFSERRAA
jgi:hypothetical protein